MLIAVIMGFGLTFFTFVEHKNFEDFGISFLVGVLLGIPVGIFEEFVIINKFRRIPLVWSLIIKMILYTLGVGIFFLILAWVYIDLNEIPFERFMHFIEGGEFFRAIIYSLLVMDFVIVFNQLQKLLGSDILFLYAYGKYQEPEYEERIFMFLDISSSTELAEAMQPDKYFGFIDDFFHDISEPVLKTSANIYQYVGDEVVFTWKMKHGIKYNNCVNLFFLIDEQIQKKKDTYLEKYGKIPEYKAGLHCGKVIVAVVGDIKKERIYNGDVLNTTSRIRSYCSEINKKFCASSDIISKLETIDNEYKVETMGVQHLKGKKNIIGLFSVEGRK